MNSLVVQTAIGLIFVFAIFSVFVSIITEAITRFMGLRGEYLLRGIRSMVDGGGDFKLSWRDVFRRTDAAPADASPANITAVLTNPLLSVSAAGGATIPPEAGNAKLSGKSRRSLPSYISGSSFAAAMIDTLVPDAGQTTMTDLRAAVDTLPETPLKRPLLALATSAGEDIDTFRRHIAAWYDAQMDRVSGWYKRHVRWISLCIGAVLVVLFNLNVFAIGRELYTDQGVRAAIVRQAAHAVRCDPKLAKKCLAVVEHSLNNAEVAGLPIGWRTATACALPQRFGGQAVTARAGQVKPPPTSPSPCTNVFERTGLIDVSAGVGHNIGVFLLVLAGWLLMVVALLPGARFWFDLLGRLGSLRSTGPKPAKTTAAAPA